MGDQRIGILTSGGDCPGLNAVLHGVVSAAQRRNWEVVGFHEGFEGLLPPGSFEILTAESIRGIMPTGGTFLGTTNKGHFTPRTGWGDRNPSLAAELLQKARETFQTLGLAGLIVVGGDGSLLTALHLSEDGLPIVGVPKTIDNDLEATVITFGFDSAISCVMESLDRLRTTTSSHRRVMVVEVMGRHAGWIALHGGMAGGADAILIPEIPFRAERLAEVVVERTQRGCRGTLIVAAEGAAPRDGRQVRSQTPSGETRLGGIGDWIAREISERTGQECRTCVLGHLQRGGVPTAMDRNLGQHFGVRAVELIEAGDFGKMVSFQNDHTVAVPIAQAVHRLRRVSPGSEFVRTARELGIAFGD